MAFGAASVFTAPANAKMFCAVACRLFAGDSLRSFRELRATQLLIGARSRHF
jgi:hypothetical protein